MPKKAKYKPIAKSSKNTAGKPSAAKKEALDRAKAKKSGAKPKLAKVKKPTNFSVRLSALNPKTPKQLPETYFTLKGMTLRGLLRGTPRLFINNSVDVVVDKLSVTKTKAGMPAISAVVHTSDPFRPRKMKRPHQVYIIGLDKDKNGNPDTTIAVNKHKRVLVSCDCENYVLGGAEYANAAHGAARIIYGNGAPPVMTNPGIHPFLCKHLVCVAQAIIRKDK